MKTIDDIDVNNQRVLLRADLNAPMKQDANGVMQISDDGRLKASVTTINDLRKKNAKVVVLAHLGRPKGERKPELSLKPIARRLGELVGTPITFIDDLNGADTLTIVNALKPGEIAMVENIRYEKDETSKDATERLKLAKVLATLGDVFVIDGFGVVHREQASVTDIARLLPKAAGRLVQAEQKAFDKVFAEDFDEVEKFILNRLIRPEYTAVFQVPAQAENGEFFTNYQQVTWPKDGPWNLDIRSFLFDQF